MMASSLMGVASLREAALSRIQASCYGGLSPHSAGMVQESLARVDSGAQSSGASNFKRALAENDAEHKTPEEKVRKVEKSPLAAETQLDAESQEPEKQEQVESQWRVQQSAPKKVEEPTPKQPVEPDSMLYETDSEEMRARNKKKLKQTPPADMKRPASKPKANKRPAAAAPAAAAAAAESESAAVESKTVPKAKVPKAKAKASMKRPATVSKTPLQSSKDSKAPLQSDGPAAVEDRPGAEIGGRALSTAFFPNADSRYEDDTGDWEVYEFTRQSGNLAGQKFRKILHVPSCTVYKSFAKAEEDGFDKAKVKWPLDVD